MRCFIYYSIAVSLLSSLVLDAQTDVTIRRRDFKTDKPGYNEAWKHVVDGDKYFGKKVARYNDAYNEYLQAMVYNNSNAGLNYKTGVSALFSDKREDAAGFLLKAFEINKNVAEDILLLTGKALQYAGRFPEAIERFTGYLSSTEKKSQKNILLARKSIDECYSAIIVTNDTLRVSIENAGPNINSIADEKSEVLTTDAKTMYFASGRQIPNSGTRNSDSKNDENIYLSNKVSDSWTPAVSAGKRLTTKLSECPLYINSKNDKIYIYTGSSGKGDIKMSVKKRGKWRTPFDIPYKINTKDSETSFTISPAGNEIYYVSDNSRNNIGGKDIYFIKKAGVRRWSKPQNAGILINTIYDEESVRFSKSGDTLWFSSQGHNTIGGFDIFYSIRDKNGAWDTAKNAGYPINTPWDEVFYYPSPTEDSSFYFVSNRTGGLGGFDIYLGRILPPAVVNPLPGTYLEPFESQDTVAMVKDESLPPSLVPAMLHEQEVSLIGKVSDSETGEPVQTKIDLEASAKTIVEYLVENGIDSSRISFKGYGSSQPIADNVSAVGLAKNRRVEFKILEF